MGIYHLYVSNIGRRDGRSAVAAAAYRSGEILENEAEESVSHFAGRRDVVAAEIRVPDIAPAWMSDRTRLWNTVEAVERRKDSRLAKEIEFAIPIELPPEQWLIVAREMADVYVARGYAVDLAVHDDGLRRNPHVHMMLTTRVITEDGFGLKIRESDHKSFVRDARLAWEKIANAALGKAGSDVQIDARSHAARGIDKVPSRHRGPDPAERRRKRRIAAEYRERQTSHDDLDEAHGGADQRQSVDPVARNRGTGDVLPEHPVHFRSHGSRLLLLPEVPLPVLLGDTFNASFDKAADRVVGGAGENPGPDLLIGASNPGEQSSNHGDNIMQDRQLSKEDLEKIREKHRSEYREATFLQEKAEARYRELMSRSYLDVDAAESRMDSFRAKYGNEALYEKLAVNSRDVAFGRRPGSAASLEWFANDAGAKQRDSQIARQNLAGAVRDYHQANDRLTVAQRAYLQSAGMELEPMKAIEEESRVLAQQSLALEHDQDKERLRVLEEENRLLRDRLEALEREQELDLPVPDPDGNLVTPREIDDAQSRMTTEMESRTTQDTPTPDRAPTDEQSAARAEVDRQNDREDELGWVWDKAPDRDHGPEEVRGSARGREDELDWLREDLDRADERSHRDERERDR